MMMMIEMMKMMTQIMEKNDEDEDTNYGMQA